MFYGDASAGLLNIIPDRIYKTINFEYVIALLKKKVLATVIDVLTLCFNDVNRVSFMYCIGFENNTWSFL